MTPTNRARPGTETNSVDLLTGEVTTEGNARQRRRRDAVCWAVVDHLRSRSRYGPPGVSRRQRRKSPG